MKLQTPVTLDPAPVSISYNDRIAVLGSCFADEIGARLAAAGFDVLCNPFGTLYNPVSIGNAVARLTAGVPFTADEVVEMGAGAGRYCSCWHHTSFARETPEAFLENANAVLAEASAFWKDCNRVIITEFTRYRLTVAQSAALLRGLVERHPGKQFIFTVSPIRHLADGAHGNQLSKSTLLLATEGLPYFPAYEIMMDELRDYRWWAEDMVHPTKQAAAYLCDRFVEWALPTREWDLYESRMKTWRQAQHRPLYFSE